MPVNIQDTIVISDLFCKIISNAEQPWAAPNTVSVGALPSLVAPALLGTEGVPLLAAPAVKSTVTAPNWSAPDVINSLSPEDMLAPVLLSTAAVAAWAAPDIVSTVADSALAAPDTITTLAEQALTAPDIISTVAETALAAPDVITTKAYSDSPPFPLTHGRILYSSVLTSGTAAATTGTGVNNTLTPTTFDRYTFSGNTTITYTLPSSQSVDAVAIGAHNLAALGGLQTVTVQYATTVGGAWTNLAPAQVPATNTSLMFIREAGAVSVRQVRIVLTNASGSGYIGAVYAGVALQLQRPIFGGHSPIRYNRETDYFNNRSESGEWLGREVRRRGFSGDITLQRLTRSWYAQYFDAFVQSARVRPFFYAWRPGDYPQDVAFCWTSKDIRPKNMGGGQDWLEVSFNVEAHS